MTQSAKEMLINIIDVPNIKFLFICTAAHLSQYIVHETHKYICFFSLYILNINIQYLLAVRINGNEEKRSIEWVVKMAQSIDAVK